jgi:hypothetical protein
MNDMVTPAIIPDPRTYRDSSSRRKYLVYTSAGDQSNLDHWLQTNRHFDLWITYYGDQKNQYRGLADYYNERKGAKFPNLHHAYLHWPEIFSCYESILILDDDIIINTDNINKLFEVRDKYDLWVLQPCFDPRSKISHGLTRWDARYYLRFTNFVEMNTPLFKREKLDNFMKVYDPRVTGWGLDWWYMFSMGNAIDGKAAVVDAIRCINPHEHFKKDNKREMDKLPQTLPERMHAWLQVSAERGITLAETHMRVLGGIKRNPVSSLVDRITCYVLKKKDKRWRRQHSCRQ